jgi:beta-1,4-N-acetylglucosaminyltransferase
MFQVVNRLNKTHFVPRVYVAASSDRLAATKVHQHEHDWAGKHTLTYSVWHIPRSREVGQAWVSSAFTTAWAFLVASWVVLQERPACVLANGPGTCLPVCFAARIYSMLGLLHTRIIFLESIARTERLSMTGLLLYNARVCSAFLVQWPVLCTRYPRARYCGRVY